MRAARTQAAAVSLMRTGLQLAVRVPVGCVALRELRNQPPRGC